MCITPQHVQWTVLFKTTPLLSAVLLIICLIPLGSGGCPPGQFLHFNPETNIGVCCITVPLPIGYGFNSCKLNGTWDTIEKCPEGLHQPDNTTTESEATCSKEFECNQEDNVKVVNCDTSGQNCVNSCICNYEGGYCGKYFYHCTKFPKDCPSELVQRDCSCKRDPPPSLSPGNASNKPGKTVITTLSTLSADGGSKTTQEKDKTIGDRGIDNSNGTVPNSGIGSVPDQISSSGMGQNVVLIAIGAVFVVGVVVVAILACVFHRHLEKCLSKYRNFCHEKRSDNPDPGFEPLDSVVIGRNESSEQGNEEAQSLLSYAGSEDCGDDPKNPTGSQNEGDNVQAGGTNMQSLVVENDGSEGGHGALNNPAGGENDDGSIQAGGANMQSLVVDTAGSKGCCGDPKNPAGDQGEGDSVQAGGSNIQSLVVDHVKTEDHSNEGLFCKCCYLPSSRCRKKKKVTPVGKVNGTRHTAQFLEMPSFGNLGSELSVNGFSSFTSSINHDLESHDSTNAIDEETTHLKSVNSQEATYSDDQILSTVQEMNEVEVTRFEESLQADFDNENRITIGVTAGHNHSGGTDHDEE